jgi:hypothetical protein
MFSPASRGSTTALAPPMSVLTQPGCTALTIMPSGARSQAAFATNACTAVFETR